MLDYSGIKQSTLDSLKRYSEHRIPTGGFSMHLTRLTVKSLLVLSLMILINRLRNAERRVLSPFQSLYSPLGWQRSRSHETPTGGPSSRIMPEGSWPVISW